MKYSDSMWTATTKLTSNAAGKLRAQEVIRIAAVMANQVEALEKLIVNKNPMVTDAAHQKAVAKAAETTKRANAMAQEKCRALHEQTVGQLRSEIAVRANLVPSKYSEEIRGRLLGMKQSDRLRAVTKAIETKDTLTLAAISEGNELMTDFDETTRNDLLSSYQNKICPDLFDELETLKDLETSLPIIFEQADKAADASYEVRHVEALLAAENEAKAAQLEFDQSVEA